MFRYEQNSGRFLFRCGDRFVLISTGYAGAPGFVNDPEADQLRNKGPLPKGLYQLSLRNHPRFAPPAIYLAPEPRNRMYGRSGFYIHGDNAAGNQSASTGCIILPRSARQRIATLMDFCRDLEVVSGRNVDGNVMGMAQSLVQSAASDRMLYSPVLV